MPDHLGRSFPQLAPLVALAAATTVTSRIRLAITVLDNDFRHPVMLAKEVATLDQLSGGRVDLGLGAGWLEEDYTTTGVATWDPPGIRVTRLFESIQLLRRLFTGDTVTFAGEYYRVEDFASYPRPVQDPLPLMIGGRGRRILSYAAREAHIVSILAGTSNDGRSRGRFEEQLTWIADAGGSERDDLAVGLRIVVGAVAAAGESTQVVAERLGTRLAMTPDDVLASPFVLAGDAARIRDDFVELNERYGISSITLSEDMAWPLAPVVAELSA